MEKAVIIGSNGQLGSDLKLVFSQDYEIIPLEHNQIKIEDEVNVNSVLKDLNPDLVINTAAYHNLNDCEINPGKSFQINSIAVKNLGEICSKIGAIFVHFSTDYVFGSDQSRSKPYIESDLTGPVQIYGVSKLAGEKLLDIYCERYFCFRISGLYGLMGTSAKKYPNFVEMMISLGKQAKKEGKKIPSASDQILTFNPTAEIAKVVHKTIKNSNYGLYHATCEGYSSREEFVRTLFDFMDINTEVYGVNSSYFNPGYAQPKFSALENKKLKKQKITMPHWRDALKNYLELRNENNI